MTEGAKPQEISWEMRCDKGEYLAGGAPFDEVAQFLGGGSCYIDLYDTADDGWNGAEMIWISEAGEPLTYGGKPVGASSYRITFGI